MSKKLKCLITVLCMLLSFSACGTKEDAIVTNVTEIPSQTTTTTATKMTTKATTTATQGSTTTESNTEGLEPSTKTDSTTTAQATTTTKTTTTTTKATTTTTTARPTTTTTTTTTKPTATATTTTTQTQCSHWWRSANCENPKTCYYCGAIEGEPLGHDWGEGPTCTKEARCKRCYAKGEAKLGHDFVKGECTRCDAYDSNYYETFKVGETWVLDGEWEVTVNSATTHYLCNRYEEYTDGQVVLIEYTYKNIGQEGEFWARVDGAYDAEGETADGYACGHDKFPKKCIAGTRCTASEAYILNNDSDTVIVCFELYNSQQERYIKAKFEVPIN